MILPGLDYLITFPSLFQLLKSSRISAWLVDLFYFLKSISSGLISQGWFNNSVLF